MELRISGTEVFMTLDKGYVTEDDNALLQEVSKYKPLADWLTKYRPSDFVLSTITVRSIHKVAQRIASLVLEITLVAKGAKENLVQTVTLSEDNAQVILLPIVVVENEKYGVLVSQNRVALGATQQVEAFTGVFGKDGTFDSLAAAKLLQPLGIPTNESQCLVLSEDEIALGSDDGFPPVRPMYVEKGFTKAEFDTHFGSNNKAVVDGSSWLEAYPVLSIGEHTKDLKALLAASMYNAKVAALVEGAPVTAAESN